MRKWRSRKPPSENFENEILSCLITNDEINEVLQKTEFNKLSQILSKDTMSNLEKVNEKFAKYDKLWSTLSEMDKNKLKNCKSEITVNSNNLLHMINGSSYNDEKSISTLIENFNNLLITCDLILGTINNNLIEASKDSITLSNMFLQDKYGYLLSENEEVEKVNSKNIKK